MIRNILKGDFKEILDDLKKQMLEHAERLEFEQAEAVKQKIILLEQYQMNIQIKLNNIMILFLIIIWQFVVKLKINQLIQIS